MLTQLEQAIHLAVRAHTGQMDEDGMPHIVHCMEVMQRVKEAYEKCPNDPAVKNYTLEEMMIAAILHDAPEDSFDNETALERVDLERVLAMFGQNVHDIVDGVTRRKVGTEKEFYRDFIYRARANAGSALLKICDLSHNISRTPKIKQAKWRNKLEYKYGVALRVLLSDLPITWEQASWRTTWHDEGNLRIPTFYIADPNGKEIEITEAEFRQFTAQ